MTKFINESEENKNNDIIEDNNLSLLKLNITEHYKIDSKKIY